MKDLLDYFWGAQLNDYQERMHECHANLLSSQAMAKYEQGRMVEILNDWLDSIGVECVISCDNIHMDGLDYTIEAGCEEIISIIDRIEGEQ